ncbi:MAG TPA: glycoside hydrolase family 15 protein [Chitinophagaceae bacterium]|nr:glycoside hydrolase family 15 protein [Chitinophagaceae bacterium]
MHKYNMGIIGNCSYMAYIDTRADVKWMCLPRFDSSFLFGGLLDPGRGGCFRVTPPGPLESRQYYLPNTNVLATEFTCAGGRFRVIDFAPRFLQHQRFFRPLMLVRKLEWLEGTPEVLVECEPRGAYGATVPQAVAGSNHIRYLNLSGQVRLTTDIPLDYILDKRSFVLNRNRYLVLTYGEPLEAPLEETAERFLYHTVAYWEQWIKSSYLPDIYQREVIRSALVLKLHQYENTGGIVASGSTSLPEFPGSGRNWDYRYCWLRDSYYTLQAFNVIGHFDELEKYFQFIQNLLVSGSPALQPLYSITGERQLTEQEIPLEGYLGNRPVRIGNEAYRQRQNDVYGQVLLSLLPLILDQRLAVYSPSRESYRDLVQRLLQQIETTLDQPDAGIWEFRHTLQQNCYTLLFHWAGGQAAARYGALIGDAAMTGRARAVIGRATELLEKCYDPAEGAYMQAVGSAHADASTLKLITMQYLPPGSDRALAQVRAIENRLRSPGGLIYRYRHADDFGSPGSTFLVCSCWYAEALAYLGKLGEAREAFERILACSNHLGLFSEDVGDAGSQWGNFPQTYSHVGLINTAFRISRLINKPLYLL